MAFCASVVRTWPSFDPGVTSSASVSITPGPIAQDKIANCFQASLCHKKVMIFGRANVSEDKAIRQKSLLASPNGGDALLWPSSLVTNPRGIGLRHCITQLQVRITTICRMFAILSTGLLPFPGSSSIRANQRAISRRWPTSCVLLRSMDGVAIFFDMR